METVCPIEPNVKALYSFLLKMEAVYTSELEFEAIY